MTQKHSSSSSYQKYCPVFTYISNHKNMVNITSYQKNVFFFFLDSTPNVHYINGSNGYIVSNRSSVLPRSAKPLTQTAGVAAVFPGGLGANRCLNGMAATTLNKIIKLNFFNITYNPGFLIFDLETMPQVM